MTSSRWVVALFDAVTNAGGEESKLWDATVSAAPMSNGMVDLTTPLSARAAGLSEGHFEEGWFDDARHVLVPHPTSRITVMLRMVRPVEPWKASHLARELFMYCSLGLEHFKQHVPAEFASSIVTEFERQGVTPAMVAMNISRSRGAEHYLQAALDGNAVGGIMRLNSVVLQIRSLLAKGRRFDSESDLIAHATAMYHRNVLRQSKPTTTRRNRKRMRLSPPTMRAGFSLYRTDGAARGQGHASRRSGSGWGAAYFGETGRDDNVKEAAWG